ncbi:hypothetical protein EJ08DRAFT_665233 [Tothia fuscella]|uniref:DUF1989 domain-containing protein n=1 Tax=Tothia fuscella TaxID=1048955 RepID=A0A9P4TTJ5_9PEZI|nr:hypothetical protein EJ08DRAFT_665233 [Tothia fuscella]
MVFIDIRAETHDETPEIQNGSTSTIVKAGHGHAFPIKKGTKFRIIDTHGKQIVDLTAWVLNKDNRTINKHHHFSADHTRWALQGATPAIGESLLTNTAKPLLKITDDTVKVHDMTFACCYPELYAKEGYEKHRSCSGNIAEAMRQWGIASHLEVTSPFNVFQNTPFYSLKGGLLSSRPGDYIEFEVMLDCVVAVSSCPYDLNGFGKPTDIEIVVGV